MESLLETIRLQRKASLPNKSSWVFASAGSGKTTILTNRVLRLLLEGVNPEKILCLTFTNVATAEMQERINHRLSNWLIFNDDNLRNDLKELTGENPTLKLIQNARSLLIKTLEEDQRVKIQTIHSFCQNLIKGFPFEAGINPNFQVIDSYSEKLLLAKAKKRVFDEAKNDDEIKSFLTHINSQINEDSFDELLRLILSKKEILAESSEKLFGVNQLVAYLFKIFNLDPSENIDEIFNKFCSEINHKNLKTLKNTLANSSSKKNQEISAKISIFNDSPNLNNFEILYSALFTDKKEPRVIYGDVKSDNEILQIYSNSQRIVIYYRRQFIAHKICQNSQYLIRIADRIIFHYQSLKRQGGYLDYNDLIFLGSKLVNDSSFADWVRMKIDSGFDHILVDESQDTNHQQWSIIKALTEDFYSGISSSNNPRSIFIVGDEKQSIYSFQGAQPQISKEIFDFFKKQELLDLQEIKLNSSFRSGSEILKAVDQIFNCEEFICSISKISNNIAHKAIKNIKGKVEIWPPTIAEKKDINREPWQFDFSEHNQNDDSSKQLLAKLIGGKIISDIQSSRSLENQVRPIKYSDYMVLLRNRTNGLDAAIIDFFTKNNIPFSSQSKIRFSTSLLIQDLLSLSRFCLFPDDDLNLSCVLKSPFFNISEEMLIELCNKRFKEQGLSLSKVLDQNQQYFNISKKLDQIKKLSQDLNPFLFYSYILHQKNYRQNFLISFGSSGLEIIDGFLSVVNNFCLSNIPNLQKLLEFIEDTDPEISIDSADKRDAVRISTIHSAKGAQAPIVMLADCCYKFNQLKATKEPIIWLDENQIKLPIWVNKDSNEIDLLQSHKKTKYNEAFDESLRLLYVGMTRAENELYIMGHGSNSDPNCWHNIISSKLSKHLTNHNNLQYASIIRKNRNGIVKNLGSATCDTSQLERYSCKKDKTGTSQARGDLIHKILEIFAKSPIKDLKWLEQISKNEIHKNDKIDKQEKIKIETQIKQFISSNYFDQLFSGRVKSEVEITFNNKIKRIDLIIENENNLLIVDFKSEQKIPEILPDEYSLQLVGYKKALQSIYPNKEVRCAIFWVSFLKLDYIK